MILENGMSRGVCGGGIWGVSEEEPRIWKCQVEEVHGCGERVSVAEKGVRWK